MKGNASANAIRASTPGYLFSIALTNDGDRINRPDRFRPESFDELARECSGTTSDIQGGLPRPDIGEIGEQGESRDEYRPMNRSYASAETAKLMRGTKLATMRVIAGTARGRHLVAPDSRGTRPLADRAREGIFSAISDWVQDARVLDLYAGSGSIGIEALSRGAAHATFVENGRKALEALRRNLAAVGFEGQATIAARPVKDFLARAAQTFDMSFDLFFFDPPWSLATELIASEMQAGARLAGSGAEMVVHRRHPGPLPVVPAGWQEAGVYRYGDSVLFRLAAPSSGETAE